MNLLHTLSTFARVSSAVSMRVALLAVCPSARLPRREEARLAAGPLTALLRRELFDDRREPPPASPAVSESA